MGRTLCPWCCCLLITQRVLGCGICWIQKCPTCKEAHRRHKRTESQSHVQTVVAKWLVSRRESYNLAKRVKEQDVNPVDSKWWSNMRSEGAYFHLREVFLELGGHKRAGGPFIVALFTVGVRRTRALDCHLGCWVFHALTSEWIQLWKEACKVQLDVSGNDFHCCNIVFIFTHRKKVEKAFKDN